MRKLPLTIPFLALVFSLLSPQALAYGIFSTGGQSGYDISYPQGNNPPLSSFDFLVVGTTDGRAYTDNPYLKAQAALAISQNKILSLYLNLNAPVGSTVKGNTSTPQSCVKNDKLCQAYNYGYNAADYSYKYALSNSASSTMWWLDIETGNSWSTNTAINDNTIQGAVDYFNNAVHPIANNVVATVGIYSATSSMWNSIAGTSFIPIQTINGQVLGVVPNWIPGAPSTNTQSVCNETITPNGQAWLMQYVGNGLDHDYACQ